MVKFFYQSFMAMAPRLVKTEYSLLVKGAAGASLRGISLDGCAETYHERDASPRQPTAFGKSPYARKQNII